MTFIDPHAHDRAPELPVRLDPPPVSDGSCHWYTGTMEYTDSELSTWDFRDAKGEGTARLVWREWTCPACRTGRMVFTGESWPTIDRGYHHACLTCKIVLAVTKERLPRAVRLDTRLSPTR